MTLISSGAIALKDAGTNPTSNNLLDTGYNSLSFGSDSSWAQYRLTVESEPGFTFYDAIQITDGTAYYYRRSTTAAARKTYVSNSSTGGYTSPIHPEAGDDLGPPPYGNWYHSNSQRLALNSSTASTVGSLGTSTFTDASGVSRTINDIGYLKNTSNFSSTPWSQNNGNQFWFSLAGNASNSDNTFYQIITYDNTGNGLIHTRSGADYYYDGIQSVWTWNNISDANMDFSNVGTASTRIVINRSSAVPFNNGISEEMSGGTDTNPIEFSDYYKGGPYHNTTGIPTSGQMAFSDFYGKARVPLTVYSNSGTYGYQAGGQYIPSYSGFLTAYVGSLNGNSFIFQGTTSTIVSINVSYTQLSFGIQNNSGTSKQYNNSGWTTLKIWLDQTNSSGTPDRTYYRTSASSTNFSGASTTSTAYWYFASQSNFPTSGGNWYIEVD